MDKFSSKSSDANLAIHTKNLTKTYRGGVQALNGLSFSVKAGTIFALLGPNGAGKSTVVKILTTLSHPDSGEAQVAGIDVNRDSNAVRRAIGCVSQQSGVSPDATGRDNLTLQGQLYGLRGRLLKERVSELLKYFNLDEAADRLSITYSGGMRRKLDIAMGLIHRPQVLFLDEPTIGLDPEARTSLWEIISSLSKERGMTILFTTHYLEEADHLADQLAIVNSGKTIAEGTPEGLKKELKGDAIHIELVDLESVSEESVHHALAKVASVHEVLLEKPSLHIWAESGSSTLPTVLTSLEATGIKVASAVVARPSLDDVYLRYTGQSLKETREGVV
ncbi:daunorubicin resistance protein DrrA family ABC transporter ATP-binding protein [Bacillus sp. J14TS2]|uniref:ATP-binding cassette domain-containing protein n=1 Tax=Bacillus sp. J14TS2 TaxID=2807188 RepID=UPI001B1AF93E|nr:ATP-binding cassette domain-containing protein [Bacillus sp. J14TS2]GIN73911.1 daunorubicin resistance protein DrrA family ABC transporter ATP-binding protein [Bacillus sp. J14TS2]